MDDDKKRINIEDLAKPEHELTAEEAKEVQGGLTKIGGGTLILGATSSGNTIGGALGADRQNTVGGALGGDISNPAKGN